MLWCKRATEPALPTLGSPTIAVCKALHAVEDLLKEVQWFTKNSFVVYHLVLRGCADFMCVRLSVHYACLCVCACMSTLVNVCVY